MKRLLCVVGPTASGKTALAVKLALHYGGEVVSCDSMQVYKGMDIGTAKPDINERMGIVHHMIDVAAPSELYSAGRYAREATACVEDIFSRGMLPIVCGGTGLYHRALIWPIADIPDCPRLEHGPYAYERLLELEPDTRISPNDTKRITRALDVWKATGHPISWFHSIGDNKPNYQPVCIGLYCKDRRRLYERIERRVDIMLDKGLIEEVNRLEGISPECNAMQAIGYKEILCYLNGQITLEKAVSDIKTASRRYAKRQMTWFRRVPDIYWLDCEEENIFSDSINFVENQHLM